MHDVEVGDGVAVRDRVEVLIADDVPHLRHVLRRILERDGRFEVVAEAKDGVEAVQMSADLEPQLILLDVMMPRKDGATALREIRALLPESRIVFLTGLPSESVGSLGADLCLEKGVSPSEVIRSIEALLQLDPQS